MVIIKQQCILAQLVCKPCFGKNQRVDSLNCFATILIEVQEFSIDRLNSSNLFHANSHLLPTISEQEELIICIMILEFVYQGENAFLNHLILPLPPQFSLVEPAQYEYNECIA
jgi:hypothetical protein